MECGDSCCGSGVLEAVHVVGNGHQQDLEWTPACCRMDTSGDTGKLHHIIAPGPDCTMVVTRIPLYLRCMDGILILYKLHIVLLGPASRLACFHSEVGPADTPCWTKVGTPGRHIISRRKQTQNILCGFQSPALNLNLTLMCGQANSGH